MGLPLLKQEPEAGDFPASAVAEQLPLICNVEDRILYANMKTAVERDYPVIQAVAPHDGVAVIVGGGPSLDDELESVRALADGGAKIFALNGAAHWLIQHDIVPHALIALDARPHNVKFVRGIPSAVKLYLATQCDPSLFDEGHNHEIVAWHPPMGGLSGVTEHRDTVLIGGGTCVGIRALRLLHVLGYRTLHLFGYDSSFRGDEAHAYAQPENADDVRRACVVAGREFISTAWMIRQADDFQHVAAGLMHEGMTIHVHGDGLLPAVARAMGVEPFEPSPPIDASAVIHPLAHVGDDVRIGARTRVWQFASVIRGARLGRDCTVSSGVTVDGAVFGDRCVIQQGVTLAPGMLFGNDVFVGPNVSICNDVWPRASKEGFDLAALRSGQWAVIVKDGASIGAGAVVLPGVVIGADAMVAAGSVVVRNVPDHHLWKRDGSVAPIDRDRLPRRMKRASPC